MQDSEIVEELERMDKESNAIKDDILRLTWWMRGGISLSEAYNLSSRERDLVSNLVKENVETSKKTGTPIF